MEQDSVLFRNPANLCNGLDRADFIVRRHDRDQDRLRPDSRLQLLRADESVLIHIQISHLKTILFQILAGMQNRMMLDLGSNDVIALVPISLRRSLQGPVVRLGSASSKIDLIFLSTQSLRNDLPGLGNGLFTFSAQFIYGRSIPIIFCKYGSIASTTSGAVFVVAALSR